MVIEEIDEEKWRMKMTEDALREMWDAPEEDVWDEFYAKQQGGERIVTPP